MTAQTLENSALNSDHRTIFMSYIFIVTQVSPASCPQTMKQHKWEVTTLWSHMRCALKITIYFSIYESNSLSSKKLNYLYAFLNVKITLKINIGTYYHPYSAFSHLSSCNTPGNLLIIIFIFYGLTVIVECTLHKYRESGLLCSLI